MSDQNGGGLLGKIGRAVGGDLVGDAIDSARRSPQTPPTGPAAGAPIAVSAVPSPDGNTVYQASGTALGHAATLSVAQSGDVTVAFDKDGNGSKETVVRSSHGALTVQNTENGRPAATVNDRALADALAAGGYEAIPTSNPKKIPKTISQTDLDRSVAEAVVATSEVPAPAATPRGAAPAPASGRRGH